MKKYISILSVFLILFVGVVLLTGCDVKEETIEEIEVTESSEEISYPDDGKTRLILNTEGLGQVAYHAADKYNLEFDDEYPNQQAITLLENVTEITIDAKANDGWKFVKWIDKNGKEVSKDTKYTIKVEENVNNIYSAVFELE